MEELLELVKNTEEFQKYVEILEKNHPTVTTNNYILTETYKVDPAKAILDSAKIEVTDEGTTISLDMLIGGIEGSWMSGAAQLIGSAKYNAVIIPNDNDLILSGNIDARFTEFNNTMFQEGGICEEIDNQILYQNFETKFENKADLYQSKTK